MSLKNSSVPTDTYSKKECYFNMVAFQIFLLLFHNVRFVHNTHNNRLMRVIRIATLRKTRELQYYELFRRTLLFYVLQEPTKLRYKIYYYINLKYPQARISRQASLDYFRIIQRWIIYNILLQVVKNSKSIEKY